MLIGIFSDSHDDMVQLARAVEFFRERGVAHVLHAGDLCSPFTFDVLGALHCPLTAIFGNNDGDKVLLTKRSGGTVHPQPWPVSLGGKSLILIHEPAAANGLARSGMYDAVIYGHTHEPEVRREGGALVINPGKTARLHKGTSTVAILDTESMEAEIVAL